MDRAPSEPTAEGEGYTAADEAIFDGLDPVQWLQGATQRVAEALRKAG